MIRKLKLMYTIFMLTALVLSGLGTQHASAAPADQAGGTVVSGLISPRGVTMGDDGNLYVAESGSGGDQVVKIGEGDQQSEAHIGNTGQVRRIAPDGTKTVVASGLPSASSPEGE